MKRPVIAVLGLLLLGAAGAQAQPRRDDHRPPPPPMNRPGPVGRPGPAMGRPGPVMGRHHLPPGMARPMARHNAPQWRGRSWAVGDLFVLRGFDGPTIRDWRGYDLSPPRQGTHWIYVDGYFLMVGNRTGHVFSSISADY